MQEKHLTLASLLFGPLQVLSIFGALQCDTVTGLTCYGLMLSIAMLVLRSSWYVIKVDSAKFMFFVDHVIEPSEDLINGCTFLETLVIWMNSLRYGNWDRVNEPPQVTLNLSSFAFTRLQSGALVASGWEHSWSICDRWNEISGSRPT